jgi:predicted  nucleic acid-binding Zn-ribbon protein
MSQELWIIIGSVLLILVLIIVYLKTTEPLKRYEFNSIATLCQTILIFVTLFISIYVIISNRKDTQDLFIKLQTFYSQFSKMDSSLEDVSIKLKEMPHQIDLFSQSIDSLNHAINKQGYDFKTNTQKLNATINSLSSSVKGYEDNIHNYSSQLESIVKQTDKQLIIWKEQQSIIRDEYLRRPVLTIEPVNTSTIGDTLFINDFLVRNDVISN